MDEPATQQPPPATPRQSAGSGAEGAATGRGNGRGNGHGDRSRARRPVVLAHRILIVLLVVVGILHGDGSPTPGEWAARFVYFTIQSNTILAAVVAWSIVATLRGRGHPPVWVKGGAALFVTITGVVYNTVLNPGGGEDAVLLLQGEVENDTLHVLVPLLAVLDVLLWDRHGRLRWRHAAVWLLYPLAYFGFVLVRGPLVEGENRYPYFFVDVDRFGYPAVLVMALICTVAFWLLGLLFVAADRLLARVGR
ncbi:hypothetical protein CLV92_11365 [Kineococcus xinjiangensis]|uniref:FAR-17a/AIG1-like protein n=1 Tax=Kineococcus xinjiangensis TaxID=512762 RepID=A0A2S6IEM0_9ACTN|nr:Pr6Pr family membrane protein [Kineococcus xinjiangensis]PPK92636.1 hypothetical protein CLV92_11365 [Kineococcus xinjiangensis]